MCKFGRSICTAFTLSVLKNVSLDVKDLKELFARLSWMTSGDELQYWLPEILLSVITGRDWKWKC
jgi:hypothetical protein